MLAAPQWVGGPIARRGCRVGAGADVGPTRDVRRYQIGVLEPAMVVGVGHAGCPDQALGHRGPGPHEAGVAAMTPSGRVPLENDAVVANDDDVPGLANLEGVQLIGAQPWDGGRDAHALVDGGIRSPLERTGLVRSIYS